jgi:hypothetical protein
MTHNQGTLEAAARAASQEFVTSNYNPYLLFTTSCQDITKFMGPADNHVQARTSLQQSLSADEADNRLHLNAQNLARPVTLTKPGTKKAGVKEAIGATSQESATETSSENVPRAPFFLKPRKTVDASDGDSIA